MAQIELIPLNAYEAGMPYEVSTDNLPIFSLDQKISLVNDETEQNTIILEAAQGSTGSLANRLDTSLEQNGDIKTIAIDNALHSIEEHLDGSTYVRFALSERTKLSTITSGATDVAFQIDTVSNTVLVDEGLISITGSDTIEWTITSGEIQARTAFTPKIQKSNVTPTTSNYEDYTLPSADPYISGSLRIYVNGMRIPESPDSTYVPTDFPTIEWVALNYTEVSSSLGTFSLNTAVTSAEVILVDYDQNL